MTTTGGTMLAFQEFATAVTEKGRTLRQARHEAVARWLATPGVSDGLERILMQEIGARTDVALQAAIDGGMQGVAIDLHVENLATRILESKATPEAVRNSFAARDVTHALWWILAENGYYPVEEGEAHPSDPVAFGHAPATVTITIDFDGVEPGPVSVPDDGKVTVDLASSPPT